MVFNLFKGQARVLFLIFHLFRCVTKFCLNKSSLPKDGEDAWKDDVFASAMKTSAVYIYIYIYIYIYMLTIRINSLKSYLIQILS
jgi:hypothetical protein